MEAALSIYLESFATTLGSREQLAIAEFADALLTIPKTLAVNAAQVGVQAEGERERDFWILPISSAQIHGCPRGSPSLPWGPGPCCRFLVQGLQAKLHLPVPNPSASSKASQGDCCSRKAPNRR